MRMGVVIACFAAIAVALVHLRRAEISARHATQRLQMQQVRLPAVLGRKRRGGRRAEHDVGVHASKLGEDVMAKPQSEVRLGRLGRARGREGLVRRRARDPG